MAMRRGQLRQFLFPCQTRNLKLPEILNQGSSLNIKFLNWLKSQPFT